MDSNSQQMMSAIAHTTYQKNRSEGADYIEQWSRQAKRKGVFRWNFARRTHQQEMTPAFSPRPALNKMR